MKPEIFEMIEKKQIINKYFVTEKDSFQEDLKSEKEIKEIKEIINPDQNNFSFEFSKEIDEDFVRKSLFSCEGIGNKFNENHLRIIEDNKNHQKINASFTEIKSTIGIFYIFLFNFLFFRRFY